MVKAGLSQDIEYGLFPSRLLVQRERGIPSLLIDKAITVAPVNMQERKRI